MWDEMMAMLTKTIDSVKIFHKYYDLPTHTAQKWSFPSGISSVNVTKSAKIINGKLYFLCSVISQPAIICSKLTMETLEQGKKYVQS